MLRQLCRRKVLIRAGKTLILLRKQHPYCRNVRRNQTLYKKVYIFCIYIFPLDFVAFFTEPCRVPVVEQVPQKDSFLLAL
jgi:hypothetical protein